MSPLQVALDEYLAVRRALGYKLRLSGRLLQRFIDFADGQGATYITSELAAAWATLPGSAQPAQWANRLGMVRHFALYCSAQEPRTVVPPPDLLPHRYRRPDPYLYSDEQIKRLLDAAQRLPSATGLRPHTFATLFGLYVATGLRANEPLHLNRDDVDLTNGLLTIRGTKFGKSRYVPVHPSAQRALQRYADHRARCCPDPATSSFFVSDRGTRLTEWCVRWTFVKLSREIGLRGADASRGPRLHDTSSPGDRYAAEVVSARRRRRTPPARAVGLPRPRPCHRHVLVLDRDARAPALRHATGAALQGATAMSIAATLPALVQSFFMDRLMQQRQASPHTIASYRDTFRLLFQYAQQRLGKSPTSLTVPDLDTPLLGAFLEHLERDRKNSARSRNVRLAAIHSFFRYVALHAPEHSAVAQRVLASADWIHGRPQTVATVWSDVLPVFETPSTSADLSIEGPDGAMSSLKVSMRKLAGLAPGDDGLRDADTLVSEYRRWIAELEGAVASIPPRDRPTATALIDDCQSCADRVDAGLKLLRSEGALGDKVRQAFRLANHAMLIAQLRTGQEVRSPLRDDQGRLSWPPAVRFDPAVPDPRRGYWRPFQIAFLLMSLRGIVDSTHAERTTVDLIWFPTGGGKTEAYLGLTAFTVFFNAMSGQGAGGVDVLMRYTLRLLTAQQFQRAATLFCAMEHLRRVDSGSLGSRPFRIGLWVGGSATPNKRDDAIEKLRKLQRDPDAENPFVLLRCPWCAAKFGPHESAGSGVRSGRQAFGRTRARTSAVDVLGYSKERPGSADTVVYRCGDQSCDFGGLPGAGRQPLPIVVIDEDVLEQPPNLLIGTVDKFAMLAWSPGARHIFGIDDTGRHRGRPPTLVIQDELHLISGPLGSMVGAYETVIEALCIDPLGGMVRPKIVASTATISRAREQVRALYARGYVSLFPPSGLDAADSFFAREAIDEAGRPRPGRLYAGVLAPAHVSLQTSEARIFATLMQHAAVLDGDPADLDPWWTLLVFFNSLRELGGALTLFSADTREYLRVVLTRHGVDYGRIRQLFHVEELTSRIRGDHIPRLLEQLEVPLREREGKPSTVPSPVDACLASNIIEVGVDIQRLSLMAIVGQPKTTSQYIQVSSRVGRDQNKPGLAVVIYGQTKPRDRSHYERFRSYHQKLYAQVEPTSVTPFSPPAVERSLHGLIAALVRQLGRVDTEAARPDPFPLPAGSSLRDRLEEVIRERVREIAPAEEVAVMARLVNRLDQWRAWNPAHYGGFGQTAEDAPLMHPAGSAERPEWNGRSWPTMSSLRNVDASCEAEVTDRYRPVVGGTA